MVQEADIIIIMGCNAEGCPVSLLNKVVDLGIKDSKGKSIEKVRQIRDEIESKVKQIIENMLKLF